MNDEEFTTYISTVTKWNAAAIGGGMHRVSLATDSPVGFGNHSCDPNMWLLDAVGAALVARRDVAVGEELTTDYVFFTAPSDWHMDCNCGSALCRGAMTGQDWRRPELHECYQGNWPKWLDETIALRAP